MGIKTSTRMVNKVVIVDTIGELRLGEGTDVLRGLVTELLQQGKAGVLPVASLPVDDD